MATINSAKQQQQQLLSKMATNDGHGEDSPYFDGWKAYDRDPYHPTRNPHGVLQMGLAENQLSPDLIEEWILENPHASICTNQGIRKFKDIAIFQDYHGLPEFRQGVASFMGRARGNKVMFDPDRIVMSGGATGASETIIFCLADPGDAFLVPSPYYPAFNRDLRWRTGVELISVPCSSSNGFTITRTALEQAYDQATKSGVRVKGLILSNPSNPLGTVLDRPTLTSLAHFANQHRIHLVVDEIYAATVFRSPEFVSLSEVLASNTQLDQDLFHVICSLSKDMGLPGFRVGIVYSYNDAVVSCARKMSSFGLVSSETQRLLASMLSDSAFVDRFLAESRRRLERRHRRFTEEVARVGINCLRSNAGLFAWMDLRHLLANDHDETINMTPEAAELELWRTIVNEVKINVSPGLSFGCCEPGWFRVCYANMDDETVEVALTRIKGFVRGSRNSGTLDEELEEELLDQAVSMTTTTTTTTTATATRKLQVNDNNKRWQKKLRLSFTNSVSGSGGMRVDGDDLWRALSPQIASPHSPMPCSPLVR